jgi:hypothetical protein
MKKQNRALIFLALAVITLFSCNMEKEKTDPD